MLCYYFIRPMPERKFFLKLSSELFGFVSTDCIFFSTLDNIFPLICMSNGY